MTLNDRIRAKLTAAAEQAREKERATMIEHGATDDELAAFNRDRDQVWAAWLDQATAEAVRPASDDAALTGRLQ